MPSCLGLYVEKNIIKYAKLTKDHDIIKIDSFGMKFYDSLNDAIKQIIAETYSYKTPISVNLSDEMYNYFSMFSLLNKKDMHKAIETEFESYCFDKGYNKNAIETRYALINNPEDKERVKVMHVSANKAGISQKLQQLEGNKVSTIVPVPISIPNLVEPKTSENYIIVNIEEKTSITTVIDKQIYNVDTIKAGTKEIFDKINSIENSYSKVYEICKNSTIYTSVGKELQTETSEYLEYIMPTLYEIVGEVRKIINKDINKIEKIYITGTASVINNIDLYFSEYLEGMQCEILKPYFIKTTGTSINIKDYIEVNTAIALALQGLGMGIPGMNFKKESITDKMPEWLNIEVGGKKGNTSDRKSSKFNIHFDLNEKLDNIEKNLLRTAGGILVLIILFIVFSGILTHQMLKKENEVDDVIKDTQKQMSAITSDINQLNAKTTKYKELIDNLNQLNTDLTEKYQNKEAIPTLLHQIMYNIPKSVQIISIENTSGKHIRIIAQAEKYEQLSYFIGQIKNEQLLKDVVSDQGVKENNLVKVTIEGELP